MAGTNKIILDVGCATGYLGKELKLKGNKVIGLEISEKAAEEAKRDLDEVIIGNIEEIDLPFSEKYFDVIICADVLEHLFDPKNILIKLRKYLKDDGEMLVVIPNIAYWAIRLQMLLGKFEYEEQGILDNGHIRLYTYKTAKELVGEAGLNIIKTEFTIGGNRMLGMPVLGGTLIFISSILLKLFPSLFACNFIFVLMKKNSAENT
jgi:SAM-dependent methyltransferase